MSLNDTSNKQKWQAKWKHILNDVQLNIGIKRIFYSNFTITSIGPSNERHSPHPVVVLMQLSRLTGIKKKKSWLLASGWKKTMCEWKTHWGLFFFAWVTITRYYATRVACWHKLPGRLITENLSSFWYKISCVQWPAYIIIFKKD